MAVWLLGGNYCHLTSNLTTFCVSEIPRHVSLWGFGFPLFFVRVILVNFRDDDMDVVCTLCRVVYKFNV